MNSSRVQGRDLRSTVLHLWYWFSPMSFRSLCLRSAHKVCIVVLAVYIDDILLTGSDSAGIVEIKMYL